MASFYSFLWLDLHAFYDVKMLMINLNAFNYQNQPTMKLLYIQMPVHTIQCWLQPQNMHRLCKYKHFIHFIKKKWYLSWIIWALVFVVIWSRVIEPKNLMHVVCYAYDEKYETNMKCIYLMIVLSKFFWFFCRRVTTSSEIFKDFNNGFERKCRYLEIRIHAKTSINHYLKTN